MEDSRSSRDGCPQTTDELQRTRLEGDCRAQSELVGNVLLIGVVVVVATVIGVGVAINFVGGGGDLGEETKRVDIQASATTETLTLSHNGGSSVNNSNILVIASNGSAETRFNIDAANITGGDGSFDPGETLTRRHGLTGADIDVRVFYRGSGSGRTFLRTTLPVSTDPVAFGPAVWGTAADWNGAESEQAVVHDDFGNHSGSGTVELGNSRNRSGLVGYWPFDESAGASTASDVSQNGNDGTLKNATAGVAGIARTTAYEFAAGEYVEVPGSASLNDVQANGSFTVSTWVKTTDSGTAPLWSQFDGYGPGVNNGSDDLFVGLRDGRVSALVGSDGVISTNDTVSSTAEWESGTFENTTVDAGKLRLNRTRDVAYGNLAAPDTTGDVRADVGFEPDLVVFRTYVVGVPFGQTASVGGQALGSGTGFADCTQTPCTEAAQSVGSGSASPNAQTSASTTGYSIQQVVTDANGDTFLGRVNGTVSSTDGDGFTVSFENVVDSGPTVRVGYRAYTFPESSDIDVGTFRTPSAGTAGEQTYNTGFRPTSVRTVTGPSLNTADDIEESTRDEFGWSHGWAIDNESRDTTPETTTLGETGTFTTPSEKVHLGESGSVTVRNGSWETISFNRSYSDPVVVGTTNTHDGNSSLTFDAQQVTSTDAQIRVCETNGTTDGCDTHGPETVGYVVINASAAERVPGIEAGTVSLSGGIDDRQSVAYGESLGSGPVVLGNVQTTDGQQPVETRVTDTTATDFTVGICHLDTEDACDGGHVNETVGWVAIDPSGLTLGENATAGRTGNRVSNSEWTGVPFGSTFGETPTVVVSTLTEDGGQEVQIDEARNVNASDAEVRYCEIPGPNGELDGCDTHTSEDIGWFAVESGTNLTAEISAGVWKEVTFQNSYSDPVVVGTTNTHDGEAALTFDARNVTSSSAEMRLCESEGGDGCDSHTSERVGYLVVNASAAAEVSGIEAGTVSVGGGIDTPAQVGFGETFGESAVVLGNVQTTNGTQPVETRVTGTGTGEFSVAICHQASTDACDNGHVNETVGWVALDPRADVFDQQTDIGSVQTNDDDWASVGFSPLFGSTPTVVVSTLTENGGQELQIDEARNVTASGAEVRFCEMESGDTCDGHTTETVGWFAAEQGITLTSTEQNLPEQVTLSVSADGENIDDHVYAARDDAVLNTLWTNKGGIDGRVRASLTGFDASGFTLDYTVNSPESVDGSRFVGLYLAVNTSAEPELGYGRTPTATGQRTYGTSASLSALSLFGVNTIPGMNVEGYSGANEGDNHLGWMTGGGKIAGDGRALGFSSHSNSVNAHAVATTGGAPFDLLYADRNGNVLGHDTAEFVGTSGEQFTLDWTDVTTTATSGVAADRSLFVWHSFGGSVGYVDSGEYRRTIDAGREVYWNRTALTESVPSGTGTDVDFSDGTQRYDSLDAVPKTDSITLNITLQSGGSETPTVSAVRTEYRNVTLTKSLATDTNGEWQDGRFDNTTVNEGRLTLSGTQIGEAGTVTTSDGSWRNISFERSYATPVVVGTTNTHNGENALTFDARNVTSTGAQVRVCESEGGSNDGCDTHGPETVGYVVVDAAETDSVGGIEAGRRTLDGGIDAAETVTYTESFGTTPVVLGNVQTTDGAQPVETRVTDTSASDFMVGICHQGSTDACDDSHGNETVGWVALEPGNLPFAGSAAVGTTGTSVASSRWTSVSFAGFDDPPVVVVSTLTENGGQELQIDEARSVTASSAEVRYCELETGDDCDSHTDEDVGWFAVESGPLVAGYADSGTYTRTLNAGRVVDWTGANTVTSKPSGTSAEVRYEVGGTRYTDITNVPDAAALTLNVSLNQTSGARPTVDSTVVGYEATAWRTGTTRVDDGQWHSVTATYDGSTLSFYVDGRHDGTHSVDADLSPGTVTAEIGGESDLSWTFDGRLDAVRLFSRARSAGAINVSAGADSDGVLVTTQRGFDNGVQPGTLTLTNATATEPGGTNVTVVVESDPNIDGVYEEISDPIELDGSDSYDVTGLNVESKVFRLRVTLETDSPTAGPLFEEATLGVNR